ncbi:MAG: nucleotidyltransferase domain-containing protein [Candidatus Caldarchaeum sp.]|nr:nucleotidyltransferase domain-containing protein [Candidatus Caldarchaeum sp.]
MSEALRRREIFENLEKYLTKIKQTVEAVDQKAEIYLFGSVAEGTHTYSSDIDILVVTRIEPAAIHAELWKAGITTPFEIHVQPPEKAKQYLSNTKAKRI